MLQAFRRLFKVSEAQAHAAIDKMEDPIKMSEQAIRDLRQDLGKAMEALAEVKAIAIRTRRDAKEQAGTAADYEKKAMLVLKRAHDGELEAAEADRLAGEALERQTSANAAAERAKGEVEKYDSMSANLDAKVRDIRAQISQWENELKTLKARARVSTATRKINQQMADIDSSGTVSTLKRMREKVDAEEALAQSYGEIAAQPKSFDAELDAATGGSAASTADSLAALKARMGMAKGAA